MAGFTQYGTSRTHWRDDNNIFRSNFQTASVI
jgi:hypothetical protein